MESNNRGFINHPFATVKFDPAVQTIALNTAACSLLQLPSTTDLRQFIALTTQPIWQQLCLLDQGQSKLIPWPANKQHPDHWLLWTCAFDGHTQWFQISDQSSLGRGRVQWQHQTQLAAVGQVMAGTCHEVNQPLNAMRLRLYGLQAMASSGNVRNLSEHLTALDEQVGRCADTLTNMREMVGHQSTNQTTFNLGKSAEQVVQLLKHPLQLQRVALQLRIAPPTPYWVYGQSQRLEQVLINLINNARDALVETTHDQAAINISISQHSCDGQDGVNVAVTDNGPGIPLALQEKVFETYYTSKHEQQGTGLGLALCQDLMQDLGGYIGLSSAAGSTTFTLWLPAASGDTTP